MSVIGAWVRLGIGAVQSTTVQSFAGCTLVHCAITSPCTISAVLARVYGTIQRMYHDGI